MEDCPATAIHSIGTGYKEVLILSDLCQQRSAQVATRGAFGRVNVFDCFVEDRFSTFLRE